MTRDEPHECPSHSTFWQALTIAAVTCALPTLVEQLGKIAREAMRRRRGGTERER